MVRDEGDGTVSGGVDDEVGGESEGRGLPLLGLRGRETRIRRKCWLRGPAPTRAPRRRFQTGGLLLVRMWTKLGGPAAGGWTGMGG
ncbi:MAG: hypothetical protein GY938_31650, partial [Ketobacter sp.]|nr:hypothetical protein [Ketobacter sp.]